MGKISSLMQKKQLLCIPIEKKNRTAKATKIKKKNHFLLNIEILHIFTVVKQQKLKKKQL